MSVRSVSRVLALSASFVLAVNLGAAPPPDPLPDTSDVDRLAGPSVVTVAVIYHFEPAHEAEGVAALRALTAADVLEKGVMTTSVHRALKDNAHDYLLYEEFETPTALATHRNSAAYKRYVTGSLAHLGTARYAGEFEPLLPH
jgi:quinol monooxygenase YgiN